VAPHAVEAATAEKQAAFRAVDARFVEFFCRWRLQGLAAPYLPIPLRPILAGRMPHVVLQRHLQTGGLFVVPDTFPVPSRDEFRGRLDDALHSTPPDHLADCIRVLAARNEGLACFDQITKHVLNGFAAYLEQQGRTSKTITNELTTHLQCVRSLVEEGHLPPGEPNKQKLKQIESRWAYCYRPQEVAAMVAQVIEPLAVKFPGTPGKLSLAKGRLQSFRHAFVSRCAARNVAELIVMDCVGRADSSMVRHYFHLSDEEARRQMRGLDFVNGAGGRSVGEVSVC
jgi:hypothetical protein